MHMTYKEDHCKTELMQGDVIQRSAAIDAVLAEFHPHFHRQQKNRYFMVLTQSCDLVLRREGARKAPYIALASIRSLDFVVNRHIAQTPPLNANTELPVIGQRDQAKASDFLRRLFNNNEPGYFFLESTGTSLETDCAALLDLSIAIKAGEHFQSCLDAKILELDSTFQAKLGWLVGQMYSRVGTFDWEPRELEKKVSAVLRLAAHSVPDSDFAHLEETLKTIALENPDKRITTAEIRRAVAKVPKKKEKVLRQIAQVVDELIGPSDKKLAEKLLRRIESDEGLTTLLR